ncbi:hypothetical protein HYE67_000403 [Fusarium culmorum]|uniref:Uncharacterized protein n=1 Tax=Fusarium culmorum TaxID=5516 RepID=A0A7S8CXG2_FUSCU|nr:hypothetical protein HYE67_000403 [Fusarium culmorum]
MENQQDSPLDGSPTSSPQHKNNARSFVDATGNLFSSVPLGWTPIDTVPGWATVYTESGKPVTASRNQLTIIGEIPNSTVTEQAPPPSGSSRSGWSWVTESSTYTIDITWASTLTENPTATSESTTQSSVTVPYKISLKPVIPWWSKTYTESFHIPTTTETTFMSTTSSTESSTKSSTSSTSSSTTWPFSTATSAPEASPTNVQWVSLTISLFTCLVMIAMLIFVNVYRRRSGTPPRERENQNENNINVNVESGRFRNRPLAETNPGYVPQGWDDTRL